MKTVESPPERRVVIRNVSWETYVASEQSPAFPELPVAELARFLDRVGIDSETHIIRSFRAWVRETFVDE